GDFSPLRFDLPAHVSSRIGASATPFSVFVAAILPAALSVCVGHIATSMALAVRTAHFASGVLIAAFVCFSHLALDVLSFAVHVAAVAAFDFPRYHDFLFFEDDVCDLRKVSSIDFRDVRSSCARRSSDTSCLRFCNSSSRCACPAKAGLISHMIRSKISRLALWRSNE